MVMSFERGWIAEKDTQQVNDAVLYRRWSTKKGFLVRDRNSIVWTVVVTGMPVYAGKRRIGNVSYVHLYDRHNFGCMIVG